MASSVAAAPVCSGLTQASTRARLPYAKYGLKIGVVSTVWAIGRHRRYEGHARATQLGMQQTVQQVRAKCVILGCIQTCAKDMCRGMCTDMHIDKCTDMCAGTGWHAAGSDDCRDAVGGTHVAQTCTSAYASSCLGLVHRPVCRDAQARVC